jgi:hypothetical protein
MSQPSEESEDEARDKIRSWLFLDDNRIDVEQDHIKVTSRSRCNSRGNRVRARRSSRKYGEIDFPNLFSGDRRHSSIAPEYHEVGDTEPRQYHYGLD